MDKKKLAEYVFCTFMQNYLTYYLHHQKTTINKPLRYSHFITIANIINCNNIHCSEYDLAIEISNIIFNKFILNSSYNSNILTKNDINQIIKLANKSIPVYLNNERHEVYANYEWINLYDNKGNSKIETIQNIISTFNAEKKILNKDELFALTNLLYKHLEDKINIISNKITLDQKIPEIEQVKTYTNLQKKYASIGNHVKLINGSTTYNKNLLFSITYAKRISDYTNTTLKYINDINSMLSDVISKLSNVPKSLSIKSNLQWNLSEVQEIISKTREVQNHWNIQNISYLIYNLLNLINNANQKINKIDINIEYTKKEYIAKIETLCKQIIEEADEKISEVCPTINSTYRKIVNLLQNRGPIIKQFDDCFTEAYQNQDIHNIISLDKYNWLTPIVSNEINKEKNFNSILNSIKNCILIKLSSNFTYYQERYYFVKNLESSSLYFDRDIKYVIQKYLNEVSIINKFKYFKIFKVGEIIDLVILDYNLGRMLEILENESNKVTFTFNYYKEEHTSSKYFINSLESIKEETYNTNNEDFNKSNIKNEVSKTLYYIIDEIVKLNSMESTLSSKFINVEQNIIQKDTKILQEVMISINSIKDTIESNNNEKQLARQKKVCKRTKIYPLQVLNKVEHFKKLKMPKYQCYIEYILDCNEKCCFIFFKKESNSVTNLYNKTNNHINLLKDSQSFDDISLHIDKLRNLFCYHKFNDHSFLQYIRTNICQKLNIMIMNYNNCHNKSIKNMPKYQTTKKMSLKYTMD